MAVLLEVDKSGMDILNTDYALAVVKDKKEVYGYKITQSFIDKLLHLFNNNQLGIDSSKFGKAKQRVKLRVRVHSACITLIIKEVIKDYGDLMMSLFRFAMILMDIFRI